MPSDVRIAVAYKEIGRKGRMDDLKFGCNKISWYFGVNKSEFFVLLRDALYKIVSKVKYFIPFVDIFYKRLVAYHDNTVRMVFSLTRLGRVGVYLDWPAGTLSFYDASSNSDKLVHLYTFETKFSESVYPGFYIYSSSNYVFLCPASQMMENIFHIPVY